MTDDPDVDPHPEITRVMGPCPVRRDDPRYEAWVAAGRVIWEAEVRMQADMLERAKSASIDELRAMMVEATVKRFDMLAGFCAATVTNYESVALVQESLKEASQNALVFFRATVNRGPRWIRDSADLSQSLKLQLDQRVAYFTVQALTFAREASEKRSQPASEPVPPDVAPSSRGGLVRRAAWLQDRLDERRWTVHDLERFGGPNWKSARKILAGSSVRQSVWERVVHALSTKGAVSIRDVPSE